MNAWLAISIGNTTMLVIYVRPYLCLIPPLPTTMLVSTHSDRDASCADCSRIPILIRHLIYTEWTRAVVTDGVTLGHPCCAEHDCPEPLISNRHHFCKKHTAFEGRCVVRDCANPRLESSQVCYLPEHQDIEKERKLRGKSQFQLKDRLRRQGVLQLDNSASTEPQEPGDDDEIGPRIDEGKSEKGNHNHTAFFGRRRTHNEQLIVCCCGVIIARRTFFGSEAVSKVSVSRHFAAVTAQSAR